MKAICRALSGGVLIFALVWLTGAPAAAQVTGFRLEQVDNTAGGPELNGFVTYDVKIDFTERYLGSQLLLELMSRSIYQNPLGGDLPPNDPFVALFPYLFFDTFLANGGPTVASNPVLPTINGGAVNLGGESTSEFGTQRLNIGWSTQPGAASILDRSDFMVARITLSADASGTLAYLASVQEEGSIGGLPFFTTSFAFPPVPEPASAAALTLFTMVLASRPGRLFMSINPHRKAA